MHDRETLRLRLGRRHPVRITLRQNGKMLLDGPADNLSISGAGFHVRPNGEKFPARGERYGTCRITLPDRQSIFCQASIVHGRYDAESGYTLLGIEFVGLEPCDERRLQRFLSGMQMASRRLARLDDSGLRPADNFRKPRKSQYGKRERPSNAPSGAWASAMSGVLNVLSRWRTAMAATCARQRERLPGWLRHGFLRSPHAMAPSSATAGLPPALAALLAAKAVMASTTPDTQKPVSAQVASLAALRTSRMGVRPPGKAA